MNEDELLNIGYDFGERTATLVYKAGAKYDIDKIIEYVDDMSDGRAIRINIFHAGGVPGHRLFRKADETWGVA